MEIIIKITQLIASLSLLVLIHELGHFMFARLFKVRVDKFYLFFDPWFSIVKKKIGDTEYGIGWLPLGGYCKISGMVDESMDTDQLAEPAKPWEYRSKPAWQRMFIIIGGVLMNFLFAMVIYIGISFVWGDSYIKTSDVPNGYSYSAEAQNLGFINGDKILSVDGEPVKAYNKLQAAIALSDNREVEIERNGQTQIIAIPASDVKTILKTRNLISLRLPVVVSQLEEGGGAASAGIMVGDSIVAVDDTATAFLDQFKDIIHQRAGDTVLLDLYRGNERFMLPVPVNADGAIGIGMNGELSRYYKISTEEYSLIEAVPNGVSRGVGEVGSYLKQLKLIASPETEAYKSVGGMISIGNIFPAEWSWFAFWNITALLSIMLGVVNILPVPMLDGGHLVFIIYEMITRRKPSDKFMQGAQYVGLFLILGLLVYANGSDIIRLFTKA